LFGTAANLFGVIADECQVVSPKCDIAFKGVAPARLPMPVGYEMQPIA